MSQLTPRVKYLPALERARMFVRHLHVLIDVPRQQDFEAVRKRCTINGHEPDYPGPTLVCLEDTPNRGRFAVSCSQPHPFVHTLDEFGEGPFCIFISPPLSHLSLAYLRDLGALPADIIKCLEEAQRDEGIASPVYKTPSRRLKYATIVPSQRRVSTHSQSTGGGPVRTHSSALLNNLRVEIHVFHAPREEPGRFYLSAQRTPGAAIRMDDHIQAWQHFGVDRHTIINVLVSNESDAMPHWSPVRLRDCAVSQSCQTLVVALEGVEPSHKALKKHYKDAFEGRLTLPN
ncbi:unnamed protein product [Peniophora sp. CBMAI 1063]|nr:unnamed protein product [Peniophora sp. CBMAI 1063]